MTRIPLLFLLALAAPCHAAPCAQTVSALRALLADDTFPLKWRETSMTDGKPLVLSISERDGMLVLQFMKSDEGLWAESVSTICRSGADLNVRFAAEHVRLGPAAGWAVQVTFSNGGEFTLTRLGPQQLRVATVGWSGTFSAAR